MIGLRAFEPMAKKLNHAGLHERVGQRSRARCPESGLVDHRVKCTTDECRTVEIGADRIEQAVEGIRSEEHTSELQSLMRISYAVFCLQKHKSNTTEKSTS